MLTAPHPDYARMTLPHQAGVLALALGGGALLGLVGTFAHQSLPPVGVAIALATLGVYLAGLRAWGGVRTPAAAGALGAVATIAPLAGVLGGSVLIPANLAGYAWLIGVAAIVFLVLAWPHIERVPRRAPDTMEQHHDAAVTDPSSR